MTANSYGMFMFNLNCQKFSRVDVSFHIPPAEYEIQVLYILTSGWYYELFHAILYGF